MTKKSLPVLVMHITEGYHYFEHAHFSSGENLILESGKSLYCGVKGTLFIPKNHPDFSISHIKVALLFFHKIGDPFVISEPINCLVVSEERKQQVLIERSCYYVIVESLTDTQKQEQLTAKIPLKEEKSLTIEEKKRIILHPKTQQKILMFQLTDVEFCRSDFVNALLVDEIGEFEKVSKNHFKLSKLSSYLLLGVTTICVFYFFRFKVIDSLVNLILGLL